MANKYDTWFKNEVIRALKLPESYKRYYRNIQFEHIQKYRVNAKVQVFKGMNSAMVTEHTTKSKSALIREKITSQVQEILFKQQKPFVKLHYYPNNFQSLFAFRIDSDKYEKTSFNTVKNIALEYDVPLTWFIETGVHDLNEVKKLLKTDHEIEPHCFHHIPYFFKGQIRKDTAKAISILEKIGVCCHGFAAPYGIWNHNVQSIYEESGLVYGSDFSFATDDFPMYPFKNERNVSPVLQIPIHPICIGSLKDAHYSSDDMIAYFDKVIQQKYHTHQPICLYGHPIDRLDTFPEVFKYMLSMAKKLDNVWITTFYDYACWWKEREKVTYDILYKSDSIEVISDNKDSSMFLEIWKNKQSVARIPLKQGIINLKKLTYQKHEQGLIDYVKKPGVQETLFQYLKQSKFNLKMIKELVSNNRL